MLAPARLRTGLAVSARDLEVAGRLRVPRVDVPAGDAAAGHGGQRLGQVDPAQGARRASSPGPAATVVAAPPASAPPAGRRLRPARANGGPGVAAATGSAVPLGDLGLLHPRESSRPVGLLSTGQQRRLGLALLVARRPDLLLLDEPTNHISLALAEELEESLGRSSGTVLVASHDRWLRRRWDGPVLALA